MKSPSNNKRKGFTLVELVVVITIIGILMAIAVPRLAAYRVMAEHNKVDQMAHNVTTATLAYLSSSKVQKYITLDQSGTFSDRCVDLLGGYLRVFENGQWVKPDTGPNKGELDYQKFMSNALQGSDVQNISFVPALDIGPAGQGNFSVLYSDTAYKLANGKLASSTYTEYNKFFVIFKHNATNNSDDIKVATQYKDEPGVDIIYINGQRQP